MKKRLLYIAVLLPMALGFNACVKIEPLPDVAQPIVRRYSEKDTFVVGDTTITTGALKDYEQDSEVIFKLTVTSNRALSKFFVTTTSDAVSNLSRVLRTEPADAIDASGNFIKKLNNVVVYYAYHIHPVVPILSISSVSFNFQNEKQYIGVSSLIFTVIKKGSTQGKRLTVIDIPWANKYKNGIGWQIGIEYLMGYNPGVNFTTHRGPFFSIEYKCDIWKQIDALTSADKIDLVGLIAPTSRTNDVTIVQSQYYLVSPSDTVMLTYTYAGALIARITLAGGAASGGPHAVNITVNGVTKLATYATSTTVTATNFVNAYKAAYLAAGINLTSSGAVLSFTALNDGVGFNSPTTVLTVAGTLYGNDQFSGVPPYNVANNPTAFNGTIIMRQTIRAMANKLNSEGKSLRKAWFKRLDNSTGPDSVTTDYFELLTHDNEFDVLLGNIVAGGKTVGGPISLDEVWGFVLDDGRRGLIRTSPFMAYPDLLLVGTGNASLEIVTAPKDGYGNLYCMIKVQENN